MTRYRLALVVYLVCAPAQSLGAQESPQQPVRTVQVTGTKELSERAVLDAAHVRIGEPLPDPPGKLAETVERHYRDQGYTFTKARVAFEEATGALAITIDEGTIEAVEFQGVDEHLAKAFAEEFALRAGDVFNRDRAIQALDALLRPTRGAVRPGRNAGYTDAATFGINRHPRRFRDTFGMIDRNGQRVLLVGLSEPAGTFRFVPDLGEREDWFASVDGFVPSFGFGAAVFDHTRFNHAYVAGHLSYKTASRRAGYALGFERPFFTTNKLYVGGELHDLTASDDRWRLTASEASLAAMGPRRSYRDYYRRRGVQIGGALRVHRQIELLFAWRGERHEGLETRTDFSIWNSDEPFRPNPPIQEGRLNAVVVGASIDGVGFERESLASTYRRHQSEMPFGDWLPRREDNEPAIWRVDWTSEISAPQALKSDFDFSRHIISARARVPLSPHQEFGARGIAGWSNGVLPAHRQFAIGGIGSVHGYGFKESVGDTLALVNLEYALGWRNGLQAIGFFDLGRTTSSAVTDAPWLKGVGVGVGLGGDLRIDFGYKLDDVPGSLQVLVRLGRTF